MNSQYAFQIDYNQKDSFRVTADAKIAHKRMAFGVFFSPLMVENLALTVGGTVAIDSSADDNITYWGVDLRGRYAISEQMAATLYANVSGVSTKVSNEDASALALDFIGNFSYTVNDLAKLFFETEYASITLIAVMQKRIWFMILRVMESLCLQTLHSQDRLVQFLQQEREQQLHQLSA